MTSNVVTLPGIGLGPHVPVRQTPAIDGAKPAANGQRGETRFAAREDKSEQPAESRKSGPSRPRSPVDLNSLLAAQEQGAADATTTPANPATPANKPAAEQQPAPATPPSTGQTTQLSEGEREQVRELKKQDAEIHRHEQAHAAAGGQYAGAPQYGYTTGPDGQRYANSGHVSIDVTPVAGDPKATIEKMNTVQRAANAPAEPSGADRAVAAKAGAAIQTARAELVELKTQEQTARGVEESAEKPAVEAGPGLDAAKTTGGADGSDGPDRANGLGGQATDSVKAPENEFVAGFAFANEGEADKPATTNNAPAVSVTHAAAAAYAAPLNALTDI